MAVTSEVRALTFEGLDEFCTEKYCFAATPLFTLVTVLTYELVALERAEPLENLFLSRSDLRWMPSLGAFVV